MKKFQALFSLLLAAVLLKSPKAKNRWSRAKQQLDLTPEGVAKTLAVSTFAKVIGGNALRVLSEVWA